MPGAVLTALEVEKLEEASEDLVLRCDWEAEGYATRAGRRLIVNPNLLERISPEDWAAEERVFDIQLGHPYETRDTIYLDLPAAAREVTLPEAARLDSGKVGSYTSAYLKSGSHVTARRVMKLNQCEFAAAAYQPLRRWFGEIARYDDSPVVGTMP